MSKARTSMLNALEELSSSDSESEEQRQDGSGDAQTSEDPDEDQPAEKKTKKGITIEDLQRAGYKSGPSVLNMKAPQEAGPQNWNWSDGKAAKKYEPVHETLQEREQTRHAATEGAEQGAEYAMKAAAQVQRLHEERRKEREQLERERRLTFNQKEKRKRDEGKASRGKNYVEEEKRVARGLGMYSGFD
mmetsp:Transcript_8892/g.18981  ORF Transcript_8892/g.18981 Transcript_8892/m.18981 type:complete len:189 (+) Transcript_8892:60-626(+)|eukprot:CAMPEP_0202891466 /NCGR_PEP_ID=MMETSP1392-20130828/1516_1 /ASSEMBLY_ACC=CAM_ASM_000868 /TAXON_ID=225041 /ORGANISM="Chlamydomonas chlamydogama, Strain SAG 11-48b" /LENGTH=188 /DNA_ID=CAMNT_0049575219 /DNA_START=60 /DNA_END=626 /DNA_ORIENTATION=+